MPVRRIPSQEEDTDPDLVHSLVEELNLNQESGPEDAPLIVEEEIPYSNRIQVTVIWDRWKNIAPETRGRIIMDAYQQARGADQTLAISLALGLTKSEARRLGVIGFKDTD